MKSKKVGKWIIDDPDNGTWGCSVCGIIWYFTEGTPKDNEANYCPTCGADLTEGHKGGKGK